MKITIHRGINQIGGCITEISSEAGTRIVIDFGHNLPDGDKPSEDKYANENAAAKLLDGVSAVFYTHNHGDHVELFKYVPEGIKQYIGPLAREVMEVKLRHMAYLEEQKEECRRQIEKLDHFDTYTAGKPIPVGDITVTPYSVSHSATDSYMLVISADEKTILHTGDYREHGYHGSIIFDSIEENGLAGNVDVLVTEGTNIGQADKKVTPEETLKAEFDRLMDKYDNVFILSSSADADRLESIYSAHENHPNKPFVTDIYQKKVMLTIANHWKGKDDYYRFDEKKIIDYKDYNWKLKYWMKKKGFVMMIRRSDKFQGIINKTLPFCKPDRTCIIYSQYRGYIIPGKGGFCQAAKDFVDQFPNYEYIHTSGHASKETLIKLCDTLQPKSAIIPIHKDAGTDIRSILEDSAMKRKVLDTSGEIDGIEVVVNN